MKKYALLTAVVLSAIGSRLDAAVLYSQPANGAGTVYKSSWYSPDGLDGDAYVWEAFTLGSTASIGQLTWRGGYTNVLSGAGMAPVYNFRIQFWNSIPGNSQPNVGNYLVPGKMAEFVVGSNAGETAAGTFGGVPMYDYSYILPTPFVATAGTTYWVQIEAYQGVTPFYSWPPDWGLAASSSGDGSYFRMITGGTNGGGNLYQIISGNAAFSLLDVPPPTPMAITWTGAANDPRWSLASNWSPRQPNLAGDSVTFAAAGTATKTVSLNSSRTVGHLIFGDSNGLSPAGWTLDNNGSNSNTLTLADSGASPSITVNWLDPANKATISAKISGTQGLIKDGQGALVLSSTSNNYSGGTTVNSGTLTFATAKARPTGDVLTINKDTTINLGAIVVVGAEAANLTSYRTQLQAGTIKTTTGLA
ncbi:MAG: autotransporter-associated beta strand repeat-containing protein, partial [Phycisphaerae bacterium]